MKLKTSKPFYWYLSGLAAVPDLNAEYSTTFVAKRGWYQWQSRGLVYLG